MIPYFELSEIPLFGSITLKPFGMLVVAGILTGSWFAQKRAKEAGIPSEEMSNAVKAAVIPGLVFSHVLDLFISHSERIEREGFFVIFKIWDGLSSMEGFLGAFVGMWFYFKFIAKKGWLRHADIIVQALVVGWIFGRLGCTVAHDHPGELSDFFLAVQYPGGARYDLGFLEFLYTLLILFPAMLLVHKLSKKPGSTFARPGSYVAVASLLYGPVRFALDFLRANAERVHSDLRFGGLTDAQWACLALTIFGVVMWLKRPRLTSPESPAGKARS